ncbi:MAG TPA: radical SAM protein [Polyangiales bacterium]
MDFFRTLRGRVKLPVVAPKPSLVSWNLTAACNLRCPHCYLDAGRRRERELSPAEALRVVDELAALGTQLLILTGGEPLLRADLYAIAERAAAHRMLVVLGSNGTLLDAEVARRLAAAGVRGVGLSIDSTDPAKHDAFRGLPGAWARTLRAIDACHAHGLEVVVQTTLTHWNLCELDALIALAREKGAHAFNAYYLVCTGRGEALSELDPEQYQASITKLVDGQQSLLGQMMLRAKCAPHAARIASERAVPMAGSLGCVAGRSYLRIGPEGEITPCPYLPQVLGNVRDDSLAGLWAHAPALGVLRARQLGGRCGRCEYGDVCGGCRARALALRGDVMAEDPWCNYQPAPGARRDSIAISWTPEATARLQRVPEFIRERLKLGLEAHARARSLSVVTPELMAEIRRNMGGHPFGGRPRTGGD